MSRVGLGAAALLMRGGLGALASRGVPGLGTSPFPAAALAAAAEPAIAPWAQARCFGYNSVSDPQSHPHHRFADSHRPDEAPTYQVGPEGRVQVAQGQRQQFAAAQRITSRPQGPNPAAVLSLADQFGLTDGSQLLRTVAKLQVERQHALLEHAAGVALHLQGLGIAQELVGRMLQHCPALFSFPAEERAEVLMSELMGEKVGKTAVQAAELFVRCPALANTRHVMPSIVRLVADHHTD